MLGGDELYPPRISIHHFGSEHLIILLQIGEQCFCGLRLSCCVEKLETTADLFRKFNLANTRWEILRRSQRQYLDLVDELFLEPTIESGELHELRKASRFDFKYQIPLCIIFGPIRKIGRNVPMKTAAMMPTAMSRTIKLMVAANMDM